MKRRLTLLLAAVLVVVAIPATMAAAGDPGASSLRIRYVNDTDANRALVGFEYDGPAKDLDSLKAQVDGKDVTTGKVEPLAQSTVGSDVAFVIDASSQMGTPDDLAANRDALRSMIDGLGPSSGVDVVSFGSQVHSLSTLNDDRAAALDSIKDLGSNQGDQSAMLDGLRRGLVDLAAAPASHQTAVVLVTNGADSGSVAGVNDIQARLAQTGAPLYVVALGGQPALDGSGLSTLVEQSGGRSVTASKPGDVARAMASVQSMLDHRYVTSFPATATTGQRDLRMDLGNTSASVSFSSGAISNGVTELTPLPSSKPFGPAFLRSDLAKYLALAAVALALGLAVYGVGHLIGTDRSALAAVLRPYSDGVVEDEADEGALAQTALLQRAVQMTEDFAEKQGFLATMESKLEQADLPLRAAEAMFFWAAATVVIGLAGLALLGLVPGLMVLVVVGLLPMGLLNFLASRRRKQFNAQLPDTLSLLSGSLRAGYSLMQGMEAVAQEVTEPMGKELRRVCTEARLGRDLEEALSGVAERLKSRDFEWAVMAIRIQREVGGNLAELLLTVAETMTHRERLRREVAALTAEGKISAIVLGILPPGLGGFMALSNPGYMHGLFDHTLGQIMLGVALLAMVVGFVWMKKIVEIEI